MSERERDRIVAIITDYLNGVACIDTGDMADALIAAGVTMPAPKPPRGSSGPVRCGKFLATRSSSGEWNCTRSNGHDGECR